MGNRLYTAAVVFGWLAAMGWLVSERILPPFYGGDAPATRPSNQTEPVAWRIEVGDKACGRAVLQAVAGDSGAKEVHSLLQLDRIEVPKGAPVWIAPMLKSLRSLSVTMRTITVFDALDSLSSFQSRLEFNQSETTVDIRGRVIDGELKLTVRVGELIKRFTHAWTGNAVVGGDLTPSGRLLPLYQGRHWTNEVYNPLGSPSDPIELIEAEVTELLRMTVDGESFDAWRVEFRSSEIAGGANEGRVRAILFVANDGRILKQQAYFFGSSITFYRESDSESRKLASLLELSKYATITEVTHGGDTAGPADEAPQATVPDGAGAIEVSHDSGPANG